MADPAVSPVDAYVGLGANLGDAAQTVLAAAREIAALPGMLDLRLASLYRSAPIDAQGPDFVNTVARLRTTLAPLALLRALLAIEARHGRERPYRNAPRTLDLDLLLHGQARMTSAELTLPHPRMRERAFVLIPLAELAPDLDLDGTPAAVLAARQPGDVQRLDNTAADSPGKPTGNQ